MTKTAKSAEQGACMTDDPGRVLVVDEDYDTLDVLARTLREQGARVALATDGQSGLKHAVEIAAEVVLVERDVRVLDIRTFLDVLADTPRTADAHVFVLGTGDPSELGSLHLRAEPIVKPFHAEEVAARVMDVIRARRAPARAPELEGDLQQVALFDLLQVFAVNQRTGQLSVESGAFRGHIWVQKGRVVDATCSMVTGEKALFRVLALSEGQFVFYPDRKASRIRIDAPTEHLLMEAVRHVDERKALETELPPFDAQVHVVVRPKFMDQDVAPECDDVMSHLDEPRSILELLDLVPKHDLLVLQAVAKLRRAGALEVYEAVRRVRFCTDEEVPALRGAALRLRRSGVDGHVRIGVTGSVDAVTRFARALVGLEEFVAAAEPPAATGIGAFGVLGRLQLSGTEVEMFALPPDLELRPWWGAFLAASRVVIVLDGEVEHADLRLVAAGPDFDRPTGAVDTLRAAIGPTTTTLVGLNI